MLINRFVEIGECPISGRNWKIIGIVVLVIILLVLILLPKGAGPLNVFFNPAGPVSPGSTTNLIVEVRNTLDRDLAIVEVSVQPIDNLSLSVATPIQTQQSVGKNELRIFRFPIAVAEVLDGTYSLEVIVKMDGKEEKTRALLDVRSS